MATTTIGTVMEFHKANRRLYETFRKHGAHVELAQHAVSLFMCLDQTGFKFVFLINAITLASTIHLLLTETDALLRTLGQEEGVLSDIQIPLISAFSIRIIDVHFFDFHKRFILRVLRDILGGVGRIIFDENLIPIANSYDLAVKEYNERVEYLSGRRWLTQPPPPPVHPTLPLELTRPWVQRYIRESPRDARSLFITFSKGFSMRHDEVTKYFNKRWWDCVEKVALERRRPPMYGVVVFKNTSFIRLILNGERVLKFKIFRKKFMWTHKYVPRIVS